MRLSVIIPAYNTHRLTARHVEEIMKSTRLPDEIIVVNDGGDPSLRDMLYAVRGAAPIIYLRINEDILWNYNGAYNLGFWFSRGDVISFEDGDHIPSHELYELAEDEFATDPLLGHLYVKRIVVDEKDVGGEGNHIGSHENSCFLRREVFMNMKGNDERFSGQYGWIGYDWKRRRMKSLAKLGLTAKVIGFHYLVRDGFSPNVARGMSKLNYRTLRDNTKNWHHLHPKGILNFTFTHERF